MISPEQDTLKTDSIAKTNYERQLENGRAKCLRILLAGLDRGALDPLVLDVSAVTSFADAVVILSGRSSRQVRAIADAIARDMEEYGDAPLGIEGLDDARWVLIDCNDVIVHVFDPETRDVYDLERLWSDAPALDLADLGVPAVALEEARTAEQP